MNVIKYKVSYSFVNYDYHGYFDPRDREKSELEISL